MSDFQDYYELLGVDRFANEQTIQEAIKDKRKKFRRVVNSPDQKQRANAERMMSLLGEAETVLLDASQRSQYDAQYLQNKQAAQQEAEQKQTSETKDWTAVAEEYYENGQYNNALFATKEAVQQDPTNGYAWYIRTWSAYNLNRYDEAEFAANETIKLNPELATMHAILGDIYTDQNRDGAAITEYQTGAQLDPTSPYYPMRIAVITLANNTERGLELAREAHIKFPNDDTIKDVLVNALLASIEDAASKPGDGTYCFTNEHQIEYAKKLLSEAYSVGELDDYEISNDRDAHKRVIENSEKNVFVNPGNWYWVLLVLHIIGLFAGAVTNPIHWLVFAFLAVYAYFKIYPKQYKVNAQIMGAAARNSGLQ